MASDRGGSPPPAAAGSGGERRSGGHDPGVVADPIERRLRMLGSVCAVPTAAVLAITGTIGWAAGRAGGDDLMTSPPANSFLIALGAMLLVLLTSAVHGRILRRQAEAEADAEDAAEAENEAEAGDKADPADDPGATAGRAPVEPPAAARLRAYTWATGVSFAMLATAAALGALVASSGKALLYGLVICLAALIAMVGRWPRRSSFELALTGGPGAPPRGGGGPAPAGDGGRDQPP